MTKRYLVLLLTVLISLFMTACSSPEDDTTPPDAVTNLNFNANQSGDGEIYITWDESDDKDVDSYRIYRDAGTGSFSLISEETATFYLDTGLDYSVEYSYKVTAVDDSDNESEFSNMVSLVPVNLFSPATPADLAIKAHNIPDDFEVNVELTWTGNTETDFSHYKIFRSTTSPLFLPDDDSYLATETGVFYLDEDVTPGNTYHYKMIAYDLGELSSDPTIVVSDTPLEVPTLMAPIEDVENVSLTPTFQWQNVNSAVKYKIIVRTSSNTGDIWDFDITASTANTMSIDYPSNADTPLLNNTRYWWFIAGYSQDGTEINVYSEDTTFRTIP